MKIIEVLDVEDSSLFSLQCRFARTELWKATHNRDSKVKLGNAMLLGKEAGRADGSL